MQYLPIFCDLKNKPCLLVGGGTIASRKAQLLLRAGAIVTVVAPKIKPALKSQIEAAGGNCQTRLFNDADLEPAFLVVVATNDLSVNKHISKLAHFAGKPVNVVDAPELCSFIIGSIVDRSPLMIAVSSSGVSPVLARIVRSRIETFIPAAYGRLAQFAAKFRDLVKDNFPEEQARRLFWESTLQGPVAESVLDGKEEKAQRLLQQQIDQTGQPIGEVSLIGTGPGDPDLLTFKALRLMQSAEVVLYDRLVSPAIVDMVRKDAELIYVGKARSNHAVPQEQINQLLLDYAQQGKKVVRLKGGDPFIFGRGGEEIEGLIEHDIAFQVVPGITAASGCAAYAGIPLTHRDYAQSVRFLTGHLKDNSCNLPWHELTSAEQTLVFYMGSQSIVTICEQLMAHGRNPQTPMALIEKGTTSEQRVIIAELSTMVQRLESEQVKPPTLIVVGDVIKLHHRLNWYQAGETASVTEAKDSEVKGNETNSKGDSA